MEKIHNPILRGFHPDPSIIRVGEDYYIATSTFEWWPGVRLHHSKDLIHWELIEYPLNRISQLDLRGVGPSQGIWAPCLTYDKGMFYLVYTIVRSFYCNMYDTENYLVTAENIHGPWSEPTALNNFGFDPSLFHDDNGKKYMVSMVTDHRVPKKYAGRLVLQEFDTAQKKMVGPVRDIYCADGIFLEGPHIFKRHGFYYLFSADTGTGEGHGQTIQRSENVWGPYEMYRPFDEKRQEGEAYSILTSRHHEDILLQKAEGKNTPKEIVEPPKFIRNTDISEKERILVRDDFDASCLHLDYQSLRIPMNKHYLSLTERRGWLRMYGRSGLASRFSQTLIARRMTEYDMSAGTCLDFEPEVFKQMAGLILMYDTDNYLYLHISYDEDIGKCITLLKAENKKYEYLTDYIPLETGRDMILKLTVKKAYAQFFYGYRDSCEKNEKMLQKIGPCINASFLSDEACKEGWFTGTMAGICCQDLTGFGKYADFDWFEVRAENKKEE